MNAQHERNYHLRARLGDPRAAEQLELPWRTNSLIAQFFFFLLACIALGATYGLIHVLTFPLPGVIAGIGAIALAEYLIGVRRWFFTGVEAALWLGGLVALISELPQSGRPEAMLVVAAVCAIAGWRVRNPLFGAGAAIFAMLYCENRFDLGVITALVIALASCLALLRTWRRPSTEHLWIVLALVMPIAGRFTADHDWRNVTIALYVTYGVIAAVLAITKRHHALFLTAMIAFAIVSVDIAERLAGSMQVKLAIGGAFLLAIAYAVSRTLRNRTHGFVLTPMSLTPVDDLVESGATLALQPTSVAPQPAAQPGGGSFGGAGASGDY
jgi:hypothetical protein